MHLHTYVMLRCCTFSCTCTHTSCYAAVRSHALAHIRHATPLYVRTHFFLFHSLMFWDAWHWILSVCSGSAMRPWQMWLLMSLPTCGRITAEKRAWKLQLLWKEQDDMIAELLTGNDMAQPSEGQPVVHDMWPNEHDTAEQRAWKLQLLWKEQDDMMADLLAGDDVASAASSADKAKPLTHTERSEKFLKARTYKYGFCARHQKAFQPCVAQSGKWAGQIVGRCPC